MPRLLTGSALLVLLVLVGAGALGASGDPVRVGFLIDGPWSGNDGVRALTVAEILTLTSGEFPVEFPEDAYRVGDWTSGTAQRLLDEMLADPDIDVIVTWGMLASSTACCYGEFPKPVIAPVVIHRDLQGFPFVDGASGVSNLSYVELPSTLRDDLAYFRSMIPFDKAGILIMGALFDTLPDLESRTEQLLDEIELDFEYLRVDDSVEDVLADLPADVDAIYAWPLFHLSQEATQRLIDGLNSRRLPTFSGLGGLDLEMGMLASRGSTEVLPRLARRIALNLQRILLGDDPGSLPVAFAMRQRLQINMETVRKIGVSPSWHLLVEADVLNEEPLTGVETRSLRSAVGEAVRLNMDLVARMRAVASGEQEVERSRSVFLPRVDLDALGVRIDEDRAAASLGRQAETTVSAGATLSQLIFSDTANANAFVQRRLQEGREGDLESLRLDIALDAATAYLNLLRAKSLVQVRRNNLELTRSNLELARIRRSVGTASASEVYRWESQIATDRKALIDAMGAQQVLEIQLNRIMHRPLGEGFRTQEIGVTDPGLLTGHDRFRGYTETPRRYEVFTEFLVLEGLEASPELAGLDALISAQQRIVKSTKRTYWAPTLGLEAAFEEILDRSGTGSTAPLPEFELFPIADDSSWSVGLKASLPVFGGGRTADRIQSEIELEQLTFERTSLTEKLEQRIRSAMANAWASFPGIELTQEAADAASRNLELVSDAYARGAVPIIDLLDAQNAAFNAQEQATNAVYDFLIDLMEAERANAHFHLLMPTEESEARFDRIDEFFKSRGLEVTSGLPTARRYR